MKKITLLLLFLLVCVSGYSQFTPPVEGFESTSGPAGATWELGTGTWAVFDNGIGTGQSWGINSTVATPPIVYEGTNAAYINRENIGAGNTGQDYLASPLVNIPSNGRLHFFSRTFTSGNQGTIYRVMIAPGSDPNNQINPSAYSLVQEWTESTISNPFNIYQEQIVDLSAYADQQVYLAFVMVWSQPGTALGDRWLVDDVSLAVQCDAPTALAAGTITQTSAVLSWTASAPQYEIEIIPQTGTFTGTGTVITTTTYTATQTTAGAAFTPTTAYSYRVRAICSGGVNSAWTAATNFSTISPGISCDAPITIAGLPYTTTDSTANYSDNPAIEGAPGAAGCGSTNTYLNGNDVVYAYTATTSGTINVNMNPTATFSGIFAYSSCSNIGVNCLAGVANAGTDPRNFDLPVIAGNTYYFVISTWATPQTTGYTLTIQAVNCPPPSSLGATNIGQTSAQLSWVNPGATSWQVAVQPAGSPIPTGAGITTSNNINYLADGLTAATAYQYYVRSDCGDGTFSVWSGPFLFNTNICDVAQQCNYTFTMIDSFGDGWNGGTIQVRQNGIVVATLTGPTDDDNQNPVSVTVPMCNGIPYDLFWNNAGAFPTEMGVSVINSFNQTLFVKNPGSGTAGTVLYTNTVNCLVPECLPPTALTATQISQTEATLGWTSTGPESSWQVLVLPAGSPAPTATTTGWVAAPTNPFLYTGLTAATSYDFYVRPVCSPTNIGGWSAVKNFNTTICPLANQCNYSFTMIDSFGDGWNGGTMQVRQNGIVVATLTGPTDADNQNPITVTVAMCDGIPYDLFWNNAGAFPGEMGVTVINSFGQSLFVKNPGSGNAGTVLYTNTVNCSVPECLAPTALTATLISNTEATLGWSTSGPESSWQVLVLPAGSPAPTATTTGWVAAPTNPFLYTGLTAGTSYDFYVRPVCSPTNIGAWSAVKNFTTALCPLVDQCNYTFIMTDAFGDGWNGGTMQVRQNGVVIATLTGPTNADDLNPVTVTIPLCHAIPFDLFWNNAGGFPTEMGITIREALAPQEIIYTKPAGTGTPGTVLFSGTAECVPPTCPKPNTLVIAPITQTGATVTWTEAGTATQWEVLILPTGSPAPTASTSGGFFTTTNSYTFADLIPATGYDVYVRAICSATDISFWSNVKSFTTLIANDECDFATIVQVNPTIECVVTSPGSLLGATASLQANSCGGTDDDDVWFQFVATSAQQSISLLNVAGSTTDLFHVLYTGTTCGSLTQLYCSDANSSIATNLVVGQTYYIRVYSWTATPGQTTTFDVCVATIPPPISTNNTLYTTQQLVEDVFLNSSCASVTNVTSSTGTNFGSTNGIAYFNQNGSAFPFPDGIVLTSGNAMNAPGPNSSTLSDGDGNTWPGDPQLEAIILAATGNPMNSENATKLEFDFIPLVNTINFNFVFASEEYGGFQCDYSDAFAFLLTDIAAGTTTNLAVVPNTTTPVSVVTIRDNEFNDACASVNPQYFGDFYGFGGLDPLGSPTNFNGSTVPLTATSTVIPGHQYHIKLVIADRLDNLFDSAVFLEGGSLNIGNIDLGTDFLQATNNALCFGQTYTITSGLDPTLYTFTWTFNGNPIANETGPNLTITQPGTYGISAQYINTTCSATDSITIEYYNELIPGTPENMVACNSTGTAQFDLSQNNASALGTLNPADYNVHYYLSEADATSENNPLPTIYTNTSNPQTIYVRVENNLSGCFEIRSFQLIVNPLIDSLFTIDNTICQNETAPVLPTTSNNGIAGTWSPSTVSNLQTGDYVFTPNPGTCGTVVTLTVTVSPLVIPSFLSPAPLCVGAPAPALPATSINGITGTWSPAVVDNTQSGTYTFTPNANQCATTSTMSVTVLQNCSFGSFANAVWLTDCADSNFYNTMGSGASIIGPAQNIFPNTDFGTYVSNSGTFKLRGAEVKTFKTNTANVCSARMNYRIYTVGSTPGAFTTVTLPFLEDCNGSGTFPTTGGPCNPGDQKWQLVLNDTQSPIDLTAFPAGEYALEVYYDITGDINSTTECDNNELINNNGANFISTYTLQANPTFTAVNPTTCSSTDGSIIIGSLAPSTTYTLTYSANSVAVGPITITSNNVGQYTVTGLTVGSYTNFHFAMNACTINTTDVVTLNVQSTATITSTNPLTCNGTNGTITISNLLPNQTYAVSYSDDTVTVGPATMTSNATGQLVLTGLNAGVYTNFNLSTTNCTTTSTEVATLVNPGAPIVTVNNSTICNNQTATVTATPQIPGTYNYAWTVPAGATNPGNVASFTTNVAGNYTVVITPLSTTFCNGSFENPTATGQFPNMLNENVVPCWDTTAADGIMEVWPAAGFEGVYAYQGSQFIEMNGNSVATVFQDFTTSPGAQLQIAFAHRGRQGTDVVGVEIGPTGGPYTSLGNFSDSNAAWVLHNVTYSVPASAGNNYTIRFVSVSSAGFDPSVGNFLDAVSVTSVECSSAATTGTVTILPAVTMNLTSANNTQTVCINTPITAINYSTVNANGAAIVSGSLPTGVNGAFDSVTGIFSITGTPTQTGTFNYSVATTGGCNTVTLTGTITVNPTLTPTFTAITICNGDAVALPTTSLEGYTGTWNPATASNTQTATYTFTPSVACGTTGTLVITVTPKTIPTFNAIPALCIGETAPSLPATSIEGYTGTWSPATIDNNATTMYTFTPDANQCADTGNLTVTVLDGFDFGLDGSCIGNNFTLAVSVLGNSFDLSTAHFAWFNSDLQNVGNDSDTFDVTAYLASTPAQEALPITFSATVTTADGCTKSHDIILTRVFCEIQKGISANNDGENDYFDLTGYNVKELEIFNRYGMKVYSKSAYTNQWIGQSDSGDELPDATYYYVIHFNDNQSAKTGWIYINREN